MLQERDARLRVLLAQLPDDAMTTSATIGSGNWSAKDLLGHIAFWDELALYARDVWRLGGLPALPRWHEMDDLNAKKERSSDQSVVEVRVRYAAAHHGLVTGIEELSDEEWADKRSRSRDQHVTLGGLLGRITGGAQGAFDHLDAHLPDLEKYVASLGAAG
jgi:hypothetical protein